MGQDKGTSNKIRCAPLGALNLVANSLSQRVRSRCGFPILDTTNEIQDKIPNTWLATWQPAGQTIRDSSAGNAPATSVGGLAGIRSPDTERPLSVTVTSVKAEVAAPHGGWGVPR